jgi:SAM-dependent methyltransferase
VSLDWQCIRGMTVDQVAGMNRDFATYDDVRRVERWTIREFMRENAGLLTGRVLDFGAGDQPYRNLAKGEYIPWSPGDPQQATVAFDAIMCNQVTQYVNGLGRVLRDLYHALKPGGHLVMTFATNWDEVEETDMFRYTRAGMTMLLDQAGFTVVKCERRAEVMHGAFRFPLGYGVVARKDAA